MMQITQRITIIIARPFQDPLLWIILLTKTIAVGVVLQHIGCIDAVVTPVTVSITVTVFLTWIRFNGAVVLSFNRKTLKTVILTKDFSMFSEALERDQWHEMASYISFNCRCFFVGFFHLRIKREKETPWSSSCQCLSLSGYQQRSDFFL